MEHAETAPVESVAFATRLLLAFAVTSLVRAMLKLPLLTALPNAVPVQFDRKTRTVVPEVAVPATVGRSGMPGEAGVVEVMLGVAGGAAVVNVQEVAASALPTRS